MPPSPALSSLQLEAFLEVARSLSFSKAAKQLRLTQSALSQRILNLESELELSLFVREPSGVRMTEAGEILLRHCLTRADLEAEVLQELKGTSTTGLAGVLRLGGYSTVLRSVLIPALGPLIRDNTEIQLQLQSRELRDLPECLRRGETDFVVLDQVSEKPDLEHYTLGREEYVLVESKNHVAPKQVILDHDPEDLTSERFFRLQEQRQPQLKRSYLDDIDGIISGVLLGWGRAVVPRHLAAHRSELAVVPGLKSLFVPIVLHHYRQPFYSKLHKKVVETLVQACPAILLSKAARTPAKPPRA